VARSPFVATCITMIVLTLSRGHTTCRQNRAPAPVVAHAAETVPFEVAETVPFEVAAACCLILNSAIFDPTRRALSPPPPRERVKRQLRRGILGTGPAGPGCLSLASSHRCRANGAGSRPGRGCWSGPGRQMPGEGEWSDGPKVFREVT